MHIGLVCDPRSFHTQKWGKALLKAGARVTVFSFWEADLGPDLPCVRIRPSHTRKGQLTYFSYLFGGKALAQAVHAHQVDILNPINVTPFGVWVHQSGFQPVGSIAMGADILEFPPQRKMLKIRDEQRWESLKTQPQGIFDRWVQEVKWRLFRFQVKKALDSASFLTGDNQELVDRMRDWFGVPEAKSSLNRWGVDPALFAATPEQLAALRKKYGIESGQKVIFSPRGLKPIYQGDIILDAFAQLLTSGPQPIKLILLSAGYGVPPTWHQRALQLQAQDDRFYYEPGLIPREEMGRLWNLVDIFISAPVYDGLSNALVEGCYVGAYPIVNDIPGNHEVVVDGKNGEMLADFSASQLSQSLLRVLDEYEDRQKIARPYNQAWVQEHAMLATNIRRFLQQCEAVLSSHQAMD
ncbi:MAG: glycosyltransferase family 4 protein [Bacteroidota bacterium]